MVSVPLAVDDYHKDTLFPRSISSAYTYEGIYVKEDPLRNSIGYWLKYATADAVTHTGYPRLSDSVDVTEGWNMIGSLSEKIAVAFPDLA
jgi:hypothetical protein